MAGYAILTLTKKPENPLTGDQIAEELLRAQFGASWGRQAKVVSPVEKPKLYDEALERCRKNCQKTRHAFELVDARDVVVKITRPRLGRRPAKTYLKFIRVVEVDTAPSLIVPASEMPRPRVVVKK